jgi:chromosome segregation ATPase
MDPNLVKLMNAKVERALEQARILKSEKVGLETLIADLRESLNEKDKAIEEVNNSKEQLHAEIRSLNEALNERDTKLEEAENALSQNIEALNRELGIDTEDSGFPSLFNMNEGNA